MIKKLFLLFLATLFFTSTSFAETFLVDTNHTQIHFSVQHLVVFKVRGNFNDFVGSLEADPKTRTLVSVQATISGRIY